MNPRVEAILEQGRFGFDRDYLAEHRIKKAAGGYGEWYRHVPKDPKKNAAFRWKLLKAAAEDAEIRASIMYACKHDILFFINTFGFIFEPRDLDTGEDSLKLLLFITYEFQDDSIIEIVDRLGKQDIVMEKSRDMGASWMVLTVFFWAWLFWDYNVFGLVSRTKEAVDNPNDPDCLMWKLDNLLEWVPVWMKPESQRGDRAERRFTNSSNHSNIHGYAAVGDVATGGRKRAMMKDEFAKFKNKQDYDAMASTQHVTDCRIYLSTPKGAAGAFYDIANSESPKIHRITLHWTIHPRKSRGLYTSDRVGNNYVLRVIDQDYYEEKQMFEGDYPFILDGKYRSPWYDGECERCPIPRLIAQELDIDYVGSGSQFYDNEALNRALRNCRKVEHRGRLELSADKKEVRFVEDRHGPVRVWVPMTSAMVPPMNTTYSIGVDTASGAAGDDSSNSVATGMDETTAEVVVDIVSNAIDPVDWAEYVFALGRWLCGSEHEAFVVVEENGYGGVVIRRLWRMGYRNIRRKKVKGRPDDKATKNLGWHSDTDSKRDLLTEHNAAMAREEIVERSRQAIDECRQFVFDGQKVEHSKALNSPSPEHEGDNHGDRVISRALAWLGLRERGYGRSLTEGKKRPKKAPEYSLAWRREQRKKSPKKQWFDRSQVQWHG